MRQLPRPARVPCRVLGRRGAAARRSRGARVWKAVRGRHRRHLREIYRRHARGGTPTPALPPGGASPLAPPRIANRSTAPRGLSRFWSTRGRTGRHASQLLLDAFDGVRGRAAVVRRRVDDCVWGKLVCQEDVMDLFLSAVRGSFFSVSMDVCFLSFFLVGRPRGPGCSVKPIGESHGRDPQVWALPHHASYATLRGWGVATTAPLPLSRVQHDNVRIPG